MRCSANGNDHAACLNDFAVMGTKFNFNVFIATPP